MKRIPIHIGALLLIFTLRAQDTLSVPSTARDSAIVFRMIEELQINGQQQVQMYDLLGERSTVLDSIFSDAISVSEKITRFKQTNEAYRARLGEILNAEQLDIYLSIRYMRIEQIGEDETLDELAEDF